MTNSLHRRLGLLQATAINMIDMVGIGPFIVMSGVIVSMGGPQCIAAWIAGAILALLDASVWSELGAAMPKAGGSYQFLRSLYGEKSWGRVISFLFIWQTVFQASFVVASGVIGFSNYCGYLIPGLGWEAKKLICVSVIALITLMLYRRVESIGRLSVAMWIAVILTMLWVIVSGAMNFNGDLAFNYPANAWTFNAEWFDGLGNAMQSTVYAYLGYYNICHLGSEIRNPEKNIPRSMFVSVVAIALLYCAMQLCVLGVIPWQEARQDQFIFSLFFEKIYGREVALVATGLILFIAVSSLFAVVLGYSRIPYAAAVNGNFFKVFASLHPTGNFPHVSLLAIAITSAVLSLLFNNIKDVVAIILTMRILVQFVGQAIGLIVYKARGGTMTFPFRMVLYPIPALICIAVWLWLFATRSLPAILYGAGMAVLGLIVYFIHAYLRDHFPFDKKDAFQTEL